MELDDYLGITAVVGDEGTGKTTMALSFPKPLFHMDIDLGGFRRAAWRLGDLRIKVCSVDEDISKIDWGQYDVVTKSYPKPIQMNKLLGQTFEQTSTRATVQVPKRVEGMKELWQQIVTDFVAVCQSPAKTINPDSSTMLWTIDHQSTLQEAQERQIAAGIGPDHEKFRERLQQYEYGTANDRMRTLFQTAKMFSKELVLTHYPTDVYGPVPDGRGGMTQGKTGQLKMDGFGETAKMADAVLWTRVVEQMQPGKDTIRYPVAKFAKCGIEGMGLKAVGMEVVASYEAIINLRNMMRGGQ